MSDNDQNTEKARIQAQADRTGFAEAGRLMTLLSALRGAPTLEGRVTFKSDNNDPNATPVPGPRVVEIILANICEAHQAALERITQLEALVIAGELREKVGNLESRIETVFDNDRAAWASHEKTTEILERLSKLIATFAANQEILANHVAHLTEASER
uniref:Uncharacterized protein n=1 Tax=viral metagenome TaxID=1070528 RepID=A0A6M3JD06_9ZZZZ